MDLPSSMSSIFFILVTTSSCLLGIAKLPVCLGVTGVVTEGAWTDGVDGATAGAGVEGELFMFIVKLSSSDIGIDEVEGKRVFRLFLAFFFCKAAAKTVDL